MNKEVFKYVGFVCEFEIIKTQYHKRKNFVISWQLHFGIKNQYNYQEVGIYPTRRILCRASSWRWRRPGSWRPSDQEDSTSRSSCRLPQSAKMFVFTSFWQQFYNPLKEPFSITVLQIFNRTIISDAVHYIFKNFNFLFEILTSVK